MIKDSDEQPEEEVGRARRSGRMPSAGPFVPEELGFITFSLCRCVHQPGRSPNPILLGFYAGFFT